MKKNIFFIVLLSTLLLSSCKLTYVEYYGVNIYKDKEYFNESYFETSLVTDAAKYIDEFLIPYDEIDFEYENIECYVFDGTQSIRRPGVSLTVDFHLGDNYPEVRERFFNMFDYYEEEKYRVIVQNYECFIVNDSKITNYIDFFGMVCFNEKEGIIRQFFFYYPEYHDNEEPLGTYFYAYVERCSNCPWRETN